MTEALFCHPEQNRGISAGEPKPERSRGGFAWTVWPAGKRKKKTRKAPSPTDAMQYVMQGDAYSEPRSVGAGNYGSTTALSRRDCSHSLPSGIWKVPRCFDVAQP
jgi:hypothetical protein